MTDGVIERMRVRVLFFATAREAVGVGEIEMACERGARLSQVLEGLRKTYPTLGRMSRYRFAVDGELVAAKGLSLELKDRSEVAVLPPYSGG